MKNNKLVLISELKTECGWSNSPAMIYYEPFPKEGHSNFYALFRKSDGKTYVTNADYIVGLPISAIRASDGMVYYSKYRHNFVITCDEGDFIDGGRQYSRVSVKKGTIITITLNVDGTVTASDGKPVNLENNLKG